jgi:hypothetical protein
MSVEERGGREFAVSAGALAAASRITVAGPNDLSRRLGFRGALPQAATAVPVLSRVLPERYSEVWAFRAGVKPVAFLTVDPVEADHVAARFAPAHVERRARRVEVGSQDAWVDDRARGVEKVELYIARDAALARRAAHLQADGDPGGAVEELGTLMGYPPCCVAAFAAQPDRGNNTVNRYASAARTDGAPWYWELNNLGETVIPFFPCRYRCPAARAWAQAVLQQMEGSWPGLIASVRDQLAQPTLYFEHERQAALRGIASARGQVRYSAVAVPSQVAADFHPFAAALGEGDNLRLDDRALEVERAGTLRWRLERTGPFLGAVFPFGP